MGNFVQGNIYLARAENGNSFDYRCVLAGPERFEFVDLMSWRHVVFKDDGDFFWVWERTPFQHEISPESCIGEFVDVTSYGDLDAPKREYEAELARQLQGE